MKNPLVRSVLNFTRTLCREWQGPCIIRQRYERVHGKPLTDNPKTFTEKLAHRMLDWHEEVDEKYTWLTDKYAARDYVRREIGAHYLPEVCWHGYRPDEIPWNVLLHPCVIKPTHASGQVILNNGFPNRGMIERTCKEWLKLNYYWHGREAQYYPIEPAILIEDILTDENGNAPLDYKFWCFNGVPRLIQVLTHDKKVSSFFTPTWELLDLTNKRGVNPSYVAAPKQLDEMLHLAGRLSEEFDFVRVDLYNVRGKVYFGELTFTPTAGTMKFNIDRWDEELGDYWKEGA